MPITESNLKGPRRAEPPKKSGLVYRHSAYTTRDLYQISLLDDGSFFCSCPGFLTGKIQVTEGSVTCKHIRDFIPKLELKKIKFQREQLKGKTKAEREAGVFFQRREPSAHQKGFVSFISGKSFREENLGSYTNSQIYHVIGEILKKQGIIYLEAEDLYFKSLQNPEKKVSLLPFTSFGIELEAGGVVRSKIKEMAFNMGYPAYVSSGYRSIEEASSHLMSKRSAFVGTGGDLNKREVTSNSGVVCPEVLTDNYCLLNCGGDGSIRLRDGFEIKSPRLMGIKGQNSLGSFTAFLEKLDQSGMAVDKSCGLHLHISAYGWRLEEIKRLVQVWAELQGRIINYLVSPSRRNNHFAEKLSQEDIASISQGNFLSLGRYKSLNLSRVTLHPVSSPSEPMENRYADGTFEIRLHNAVNGNMLAKKIAGWVVFNLKLFDAVKTGKIGSREELHGITFEQLLDKIGIDKSTSVMAGIRKYLVERFTAFKGRSATTPEGVALSRQRRSPPIPPVDSIRRAQGIAINGWRAAERAQDAEGEVEGVSGGEAGVNQITPHRIGLLKEELLQISRYQLSLIDMPEGGIRVELGEPVDVQRQAQGNFIVSRYSPFLYHLRWRDIFNRSIRDIKVLPFVFDRNLQSGLFLVESFKAQERYYVVEFPFPVFPGNANRNCSCPDFAIRRREAGGNCKHIEVVSEIFFTSPNHLEISNAEGWRDGEHIELGVESPGTEDVGAEIHRELETGAPRSRSRRRTATEEVASRVQNRGRRR